MDFTYALTPFLAWLVAGSLKFMINSFKAGRPAFGLIGFVAAALGALWLMSGGGPKR